MSKGKHLAELAGVSSLDGSVTITNAKGVTQVYGTADEAAAEWSSRLHLLTYRRGAFFERVGAPISEVPQVPKPAHRRKKKASSRRSRSRSTEDSSPPSDDA